MDTMSAGDSMLEIQHKRQQSHDSGTYQDWPHEEHKETSYNSNVTGEFVTVVAVDTAENTPSPVEKPFVTVLSIDPLSQPETEEVLVYRLPGERLGFGLKFEGGVKTVEKVGRLYIQSCAADSPASRTSASWGPLSPGDEIVGVDGVLVSDMTRIDCVRALKESKVVIKLQVRRGKDSKSTVSQQDNEAPPIPPRKFPRKKETIDPPQGFDDKKSSPPVVPRSRTNVPHAEIYTDVLSQELLLPTESESDDTGSSISTVVSRISSTPTTSNSSFSDARSITSMDAAITSPPSPTTKNTPFDLDKVLEPFLQLEREFSSNTIDQSTIFSKLVEASNLADSKHESTLKPPENFQDELAEVKDAPELPPKPSPRQEIEKNPKCEKRRPPPPPPPRSDRPLCPNPLESGESSHLPRLIDFVPKDRVDVVVPSPRHPSDVSTKPVIVGTELKEKGLDDDLPIKQENELAPAPTSETSGPDAGSPKSIDSTTISCNVHNPSVESMLSQGINEKFPALPSYSRLPPDGHEFPIHYDENSKKINSSTNSLPVSNTKSLTRQTVEVTRKTSLPCTDTYKHALWRNDEKSERSVRDKIAMFSTAGSQPPNPCPAPAVLKKQNKFKSSDDVSAAQPVHLISAPKVVVAPKAPSPDLSAPIKKGTLPYHSLFDVTSDYDGSITNKDSTRTQSTTDLSSVGTYEVGLCKTESSTLPRKHEPKSCDTKKNAALTRAVSFSGTTKLHSRSQSLTDVGVRTYLFNNKATDEARKTSLNHLIEQRKKSMSKLRGLVIPEKVLEVPSPKLVVDLPEIQSKDCPPLCTSDKGSSNDAAQHLALNHLDENSLLDKQCAAQSNKTVPVMPVPPWRAENNVNDLPKYSPAFKRKSLSLYYGAPSSVSSVSSSLSSSREELRSCFADVGKNATGILSSARNASSSRNAVSSPQNHSEPKSLESITSPSTSDLSFEYMSTSCSPSLRSNYENVSRALKSDIPTYLKASSDIKTVGGGTGGEEESDNDSAVSSSRSSVSHGYTPPHSPITGYHRHDSIGQNVGYNAHSGAVALKRTLSSETTASTSSNGSTLTSGSLASCSTSSSIESKRVLKPLSVEAINRKNVLSSAKYSSGFDLKATTPPSLGKTGDDQYSQLEETMNYVSSSKSVSPITVIENEVVDSECYIEMDNDCINLIERDLEEIRTDKNVNSDEENQDSVDNVPMAPKEFIVEGDRNESVNSSFTEGSSPLSISMCQDEPDSAKESVDSLDSNKSLHSSIEWEEKDMSHSLKYPIENGYNKNSENKSYRVSKLSSVQKSVSVNSIKKVFEKGDNFPMSNGRLKNNGLVVNNNFQHPRVSSIDSTTSDDSYIPMPNTPFGSITNLQKEQQFGSITSLASSTSLISQQELAQLIEEANQNLEDGGNSHEVIVVILHRDTPGGSIGITLAGGADYEAKEITVHKVLVGSPAERDGRIQKGDRILSINGKSMKGLTHYESLAILKAPRPEVVLVVSRHKTDAPEETVITRSSSTNSRLSRFIEPKYSPPFEKGIDIKWGPILTIELVKDGAGLGFSLEGGKDSPFGDQPLTVKKIFTGGCAEKCGLLYAGDELLSVNNIDLSELSRIEAWALMKRLPDGKVNLNIRHPST